MNSKVYQALAKDFPYLYSYYEEVSFEVPDEWEPTLRKLSAKLEDLVNYHNPDGETEFYVTDVKERFGLIVYMNEETEEMAEAISEAQEEIRKLYPGSHK